MVLRSQDLEFGLETRNRCITQKDTRHREEVHKTQIHIQEQLSMSDGCLVDGRTWLILRLVPRDHDFDYVAQRLHPCGRP